VKANFDFMEKTKHPPIQKYEAETKSNIDKDALNNKKR